MTDIQVRLVGLNNRASPESIPAGMARNAVDVQFDDAGKIRFPRQGRTAFYTGTGIHSVHDGEDLLFVEAGSLKKYATPTPIILATGLGTSRVFYTTVGDTVYWANEVAQGCVRNGQPMPWGIEVPAFQPTAEGISFGDMFAGGYQYSISWMRGREESGMGGDSLVTVPEGGGILLSNFPPAPTYATGLCIYLSSVNGTELFRYGTYPLGNSQIILTKKIGTTPQNTQYKYPPKPTKRIVAHAGRIYYKDGALVRYTDPHRYSLASNNNYWQFDDSEVKTIVSAPPNLYVNTAKRLYKVSNIDAPNDEPAVQTVLQLGGAAEGSECLGPDGVTSYFMADNGFVAVQAEGIKLLSDANVAIPAYDTGNSTVTEIDGLAYLTFVGSDSSVNALANAAYIAAEQAATRL
jgi:hypothetical protein